MYKIDFTPPESKDFKKTKHVSHQNKKGESFFKSKIIWGGLFISIVIFFSGITYIENNIKEENIYRLYSDVEFMGNDTLEKVYYLEFESDTARSIYNIEYQNYALKTLKSITQLIENDIDTFKNILTTKNNGDFDVKIMDIGDSQVLLISSKGTSSIQKYPIIANFAIHFKNGKAQKIQSFFYTSDEFIIQDKLDLSTFANWHKKKIIVIDKEISIFEANLNEPVLNKNETNTYENETSIVTEIDEKIGNAKDGEETEENDENLTAKDLENHENVSETEDNEPFINSDKH